MAANSAALHDILKAGVIRNLLIPTSVSEPDNSGNTTAR
jgi:hypothetical protein